MTTETFKFTVLLTRRFITTRKIEFLHGLYLKPINVLSFTLFDVHCFQLFTINM